MTEKKLAAWLLSVLCSLLLIMVIFLTTIEYKAFDLDFFEKEYSKLGSTEKIGISEQDLMKTTKVLLAYIKGERDDLDVRAAIKGQERQVFNQREITHMVDVQQLYLTSHQVRNIGFAFFIILLVGLRFFAGREFSTYWARGYLTGAAALLGILIFLAAAISRDFLKFWDAFHRVLFTNDLWLLNPETDILIQMVPEKFFFDLVVSILVIFTLITVFIGVIAGVIIKKAKDRDIDFTK